MPGLIASYLLPERRMLDRPGGIPRRSVGEVDQKWWMKKDLHILCWLIGLGISWLHTLPETNIAPENGWLEDEISFRDGPFSGPMFVLGAVWKIQMGMGV